MGKLVTLLGGFVMLAAARLGMTLLSLWMNIFCRLLVVMIFLRDATSISGKGLSVLASRRQLSGIFLKVLTFGVNLCAPALILLAPFLSSWTCDTAVDDVRLAVGLGMIGAEMLIIYTIVATWLETMDGLARKEASPFASSAYLIAQNISV